MIWWSDTHFHGGHSLKKSEYERFFLEMYKENCIAGGDIFDLGGCRDAKYCKADIWYAKQTMTDRYLQGNHELNESKLNDCVVIDEILYCHGHDLYESCYDMDRSPGNATWLEHKVIVPFYEWFRVQWQKPVTDKFIELAVKKAKNYHAHTIVVGHRHVKKMFVYMTPEGILIIVMPRGRTEFNPVQIRKDMIK